MDIRTATMDDLEQIAAVERACFPAAEAATREEFAQRLAHYADHFWLCGRHDHRRAHAPGRDV